MRGEWATWSHAFTAEECERVIRDTEELPVENGVVGRFPHSRVDKNIRKSKIRWIKRNNPNFQWLFEKTINGFTMIFSYASSSTLYPCQ